LSPSTWPDSATYGRKLGLTDQPHPTSLGLAGMPDPKALGLTTQPDPKILGDAQARPSITFLLKISKDNTS